MTDLVVVGAGGHGRELLGVVDSINATGHTWNVLGVVDDDPDPSGTVTSRLERLGAPLLGPVRWLEEHPAAYALGIGSAATRRTLVARLEEAGCTPTTLLHPRAEVGGDCRFGAGAVAYPGSVVTTNVTIGEHTHLNVGCAVQHDTCVGDFVQFSPGVLVNGDCVVGNDVFLGSGAIVTRGCSVGDGARVGAGAVVLGDVPPGVTAVGVPARW